MSGDDEPKRLREALQSLPPRSVQALSLRVLDAKPRQECAGFFGISPDAFDVMLLRAARELGGFAALWPFPAEQLQARQLAESLEGLPPSAELSLILAPVQRLSALASQVKRELVDAERAYEASPAFQRETWVRRVLVAAIVGLTLYFYFTRPATNARPRPGSPDAVRQDPNPTFPPSPR